MSEVPLVFGKYFLTEKIATGGMAEIFLAKLVGPDGFEKHLIIKKIHPKFSGEQQFVEMFVAEAKTLVGLSHGNIVPIFELGTVNSVYFIAMEYIDGPTLEELLAALKASGTGLTASMAAYICAEILKGLDYAHRKGVIHRDLSPRNVMMSREGQVKIVDFGIASSVNAVHQSRGGRPDGSYPHMSPEQASGQILDPRSDIFAAGILLWEMVTGRSLFVRDSDDDTLRAVCSAQIEAPSLYCPDAEGVLDVLAAKALCRELKDRYASANDFLRALNRYLYSQEEVITEAELSKCIAQYCPPTEVQAARPRTASEQEIPVRSGTVPYKRPVSSAKGKDRPQTESFATNVQFQSVLTHAVVDEPVAFPIEQTQEVVHISERRRTGRWALALGAVVLLGVTGLGVWNLAFSPVVSNTPVATVPVERDAATRIVAVRAVSLDAGPVVPDAQPVLPPSRLVPGPDASVQLPVVVNRRPRAKRKMGRIRVGANPWADVYLNGKKIGRAPNTFKVTAGKHTVELRFRGKRKTQSFTVKPAQQVNLGLFDFLE